MQVVMETKKAVLPPSYDFIGLNTNDTRRTIFNQYLASYETYGIRYEDDPVLPLLLPGKLQFC
jgi:hypothetical protein